MSINAYIDSMATALANRFSVIEHTDKLRDMITAPKVPDKEIFPGVPAINVPEMLEKRTFMRVRLYHSLFGQRPMTRFNNLKGADDIDWHVAAREMTEFWDFEAINMLGVPNAMRYAICEFVDYGTGGWKVASKLTRAGVKLPVWQFVSIRDILWPDGMGIDIDELPWFSQIHRLTRHQIIAAYASGKFDLNRDKVLAEGPDIDLNALATAWADVEMTQSELACTHTIAETWYTGDDGSKHMALVHVPSGMPVFDSKAVSDRRPFFFARLDERSPLHFLGIGVADKTSAINDVVNAVYNLAIGSGIAGLQQVRLLRAGSRIAKLYHGENRSIPIGPNDQTVTEDPAGDLALHALGDSRSAILAMQLISPIQLKSDRIFGVTEAQTGNVGMARRSPAYGIAAIMQEGSMPIRDALSRLSEPIKDAIYYTIERYESMGLGNRTVDVLGKDGDVLARAFAARGTINKSLVMDIKVADPASGKDARQQTTLMQAQFVMQWTQQLVQIGQLIANPEPTIPQQFKTFLIEISARIEELVRRVLETGENIQNFENVLVDVESTLTPVMEEAAKISQQIVEAAQNARNMMGGEGDGSE